MQQGQGQGQGHGGESIVARHGGGAGGSRELLDAPEFQKKKIGNKFDHKSEVMIFKTIFLIWEYMWKNYLDAAK